MLLFVAFIEHQIYYTFIIISLKLLRGQKATPQYLML